MYVLPCVRGLKHHIQSISSKVQLFICKHTKEKNAVYVLAAIPYPQFKLRWCLETERNNFTDMRKSAAERIAPVLSEQEESPQPPCRKPKQALFNFMPESDGTEKSSHSVANQVDE